MATGVDFLTELKKRAPYIRETGQLRSELDRRAREGATLEQVLADAANFGELQEGAQQAAQDEFAPTFQQYGSEERTAQLGADEERAVATTSADRLRKALSRIYDRQRENDPYRRQGIVSGAADEFQTESEVEATKDIEQDLGQKLSFIARRLSTQKQDIAERRTLATKEQGRKSSGLLDTMRQQLAGAPQEIEKERLALGQAKSQGLERGIQLFENPFLLQTMPDNLLKQYLESLGFTVTD